MTNQFPELGFWPRKGPVLLVVLAIGLAFFQNLGNAPLFDRDEGAFSEATREMVESGNYVSTTLNGEPRYDKPILTYYVQAAGVALFVLWHVADVPERVEDLRARAVAAIAERLGPEAVVEGLEFELDTATVVIERLTAGGEPCGSATPR